MNLIAVTTVLRARGEPVREQEEHAQFVLFYKLQLLGKTTLSKFVASLLKVLISLLTHRTSFELLFQSG